MRFHRWRKALLVVVLCGVASARGEESYPMLMGLRPVAVQIGQTAEVEVDARYDLRPAYHVLVSGNGVTGEVVPVDPPPADQPNPPALNQRKLRITVAPDALPGVRDFRLATPRGASTVGQLVVVRDRVVPELSADPKVMPPVGDNDKLEGAQGVEFPCAVAGAIDRAEDVDLYRFHAQAGQALVFHVQGLRLLDRIHDLQTHFDPIVTLRSATGATLAVCDNYYSGDPLLDYQFTSDGDYLIEIRDVRYQGNSGWVYSLEIVDRPWVTQAHPLAVMAGSATEVEFVGRQFSGDARSLLTLDAAAGQGILPLGLALGASTTNPVSLVVSDVPPQLETAENNDEIAGAQAISAPGVVSGRIEKAGDVDGYAFEAKQGDCLTVEVVARRAQSALDPYLRLLNDQGAVLAESDDSSLGHRVTSDSLLDWTAPADGRYLIQVRDLHLRGGAEFVYALRVTPCVPSFALECDTDKTLVAPGTHAVAFVRAFRKNGFAGEIQLGVEGLPPSVTATCGRILATGSDGAILFTAAADAAPVAGNLRIVGRATLPQPDGSARELVAEALPLQETYMPGGGRGHYPVLMHTLSVDAPHEITSVALNAQEVTLKPGESAKLDVTIVRREGFKGNVMLDATMNHLGSIYGNSLPAGISIDAKNSKTLLAGEETQGQITLVAAADAKPAQRQLTTLMANVSINFVMKMTYASPPLWITVAEP